MKKAGAAKASAAKTRIRAAKVAAVAKRARIDETSKKHDKARALRGLFFARLTP